jgi:predicted RNase H-like HicB family nuclease
MFKNYTARYIKIKTGYLGQLMEWPEVVTEGHDLEDCRTMLQDAWQEMILALPSARKRDLEVHR